MICNFSKFFRKCRICCKICYVCIWFTQILHCICTKKWQHMYHTSIHLIISNMHVWQMPLNIQNIWNKKDLNTSDTQMQCGTLLQFSKIMTYTEKRNFNMCLFSSLAPFHIQDNGQLQNQWWSQRGSPSHEELGLYNQRSPENSWLLKVHPSVHEETPQTPHWQCFQGSSYWQRQTA